SERQKCKCEFSDLLMPYVGVHIEVSSCLTLLHDQKDVRNIFIHRLIFDALQHPDINTHLFRVVQDRLRLWLWYLFRVEESRTEVRKLSFIELPRLMIDARAEELAVVFRVKQVTLSQKKLARCGL